MQHALAIKCFTFKITGKGAQINTLRKNFSKFHIKINLRRTLIIVLLMVMIMLFCMINLSIGQSLLPPHFTINNFYLFLAWRKI